jgi:glycerol-3-phosphate cytidylyltransferase-like family protein
MSKILLGIKTKSASYSSNDSDGFSCGTIEATQVDIVMSGDETKIRNFVTETREHRKQLINLSNEIERLEDMERWNDIDAVRETYDRLNELTKGVNYDKLIMVNGVEL